MSTDIHYLAGKLLIAMPSMGDPRFHRAVIFICAHDSKGAMGLVINHILPGVEFSELLGQLKINSDITLNLADLAIPVLSGGPVEGSRGFLLHSDDFKQLDTVSITKQFGVTGTVEALKAVANGRGPEKLLFILGYAGWGAGQLESEILENAWLVAEPDPEVIFSANPADKWQLAIRKMGIEPSMLASSGGRA